MKKSVRYVGLLIAAATVLTSAVAMAGNVNQGRALNGIIIMNGRTLNPTEGTGVVAKDVSVVGGRLVR